MNEPMTVWIVDDTLDDAREAWKVVANLGGAYPGGTRILWAENFDWEQQHPLLRDTVDRSMPILAQPDDPDIVILDLIFRSEVGDELRAHKFYDEFRRQERLRRQASDQPGPPAFVILWSAYLGIRDADQFVQQTVDADRHVIVVNSKAPELLASTLSSLWRRIIEEREGARI